MSDVPASPAPPPPPRPGPTRLQRITAIVATAGVVAALGGLLLLLRPVHTPTQDCGTSLTFILDGRTNEFLDPNDPPSGVTAEEIEANNERPCRERVADAAGPGAILVAGGLLVAVIATLVEVIARARAWRRRVTARRSSEAAEAAGSDGATAEHQTATTGPEISSISPPGPPSS